MPDVTGHNPRSTTPGDRASLVLRVLRGQMSIAEAAHEYQVSEAEIEAWTREFLALAEETVPSQLPAHVSPEFQQTGDQRGVWVCSAGRNLLTPCLYMQAAAGGRWPSAAAARWAGRPALPKSLPKSGELPLLHSVCNLDHPPGTTLQLFAASAMLAKAFEESTNLADWELPRKVEALVLLVNKRDLPGAVSRFFTRLSRRQGRTIEWSGRQGLPVIAGLMGFDPRDVAGEEFHRRYGLTPTVRVLTGSSPARGRERSRFAAAARPSESSITAFFGTGDMVFDSDFAKRLLSAALAGC